MEGFEILRFEPACGEGHFFDHAVPVEPLAAQEVPQDLPRLSELPAAWGAEIQRALGYELADKPVIDFRMPASAAGLRLSVSTRTSP